METANDILDEKEFCKLHSDYHGEQIDSLAHLAQQTFTGEELFEFVKFCIMQKGPEIADKAWEAGRSHEHAAHFDCIPNVHPDKSTFMKSLFPLKEI